MPNVDPGRGRESVWDYPRPPRLERSHRRVRVEFAGRLIADSRQALRVLETSHPPTWYIPPGDCDLRVLESVPHTTFCEFKGTAEYFDLVVGEERRPRAAWTYRRPNPPYAELTDHLSFYVRKVDACFVDDERVQPQPGDFYGGWITSEVIGPFKGSAGTQSW